MSLTNIERYAQCVQQQDSDFRWTKSVGTRAEASVVKFATACGEVTRNVTGVHEASRQTTHGASQTETMATELTKTSATLRTVVGSFQRTN